MSFLTDDGTAPEKIAHIMGPPDQCQHAVSIINDLLQSIRARDEGGQGVGGGSGPAFALRCDVDERLTHLLLRGCRPVVEGGDEARAAGVLRAGR